MQYFHVNRKQTILDCYVGDQIIVLYIKET